MRAHTMAKATVITAIIATANLITAAPSHITSTGTEVLQSFDYQGVRLLDSHWQHQQHDVLDYYLAIPTDDYLIGFRKRAGKPAPGHELGGWYSNDIFNTFGQIVSGLSRLYASTGDARARAKVDEMVAGFVTCIEPDGYHFYSRKTNAPHYEFDKFLGGLIDAWLYCGNEKALAAIGPITDWAIKNLDPNPKYPQPQGQANVEGYTLSENLYRAYLLTGDKKYKDFARHWDYNGYWSKFETDSPPNFFEQPGGNVVEFYHAYSHVNTLSGLAAGYMATKDDKYLNRAINGYDFLRKTQAYVTGGYGPIERITNREFLTDAIDWSNRHFETQCGSWAVFKLSKYLQSLTGDGRFGDWAEQMVYNGIGGSIQMDKDGGVQYFSNYSSRGATKININPWSCCTGTRPQAAADYTDLVYFHDDSSIFVNLFLPSQLNWKHNGSTISLKMETAFPAEGVVRLKMENAPGTSFTINIRKPDWLASEPTFKVNGQALSSISGNKYWYPVSRNWKSGDTLEFTMPMKLEWNRFNENQPFPGAVTYGPAVLVWETSEANPATSRTAEQLLSGLKRADNKSLTWSFEGDPTIKVLPWYNVNPATKYFMYLDPAARQYVDLGSGWHTNPRHMVTGVNDAMATFTFNGAGLRWQWTHFDDAGIARVQIDGKRMGKVDQYGPERNIDDHTDYKSLGQGQHTITITCTNEKNAASKANVINIRKFEVLDADVETSKTN